MSENRNVPERFRRAFSRISKFEKDGLWESRKRYGAFYTNGDVALTMVRKALAGMSDEEIVSGYFLDPCNGAGAFAFAFLEELLARFPEKVAAEVFSLGFATFEIDPKADVAFLEALFSEYPGIPAPKMRSGNALSFTADEGKKLFGDPSFSGFSAVFGNPPYGIRLPDDGKALAKETGVPMPADSYGLFFAKFVPMLAGPGNLVFVTPKTFMNSKSFGPLRASMLVGRVSEITECPKDAFKNRENGLSPSVETAIAVVSPKLVGEVVVVDASKSKFSETGTDWSECPTFSVDYSTVMASRGNPVSKELADPEVAFVLTAPKLPKVSDLFVSSMGIKTADNAKFVLPEPVHGSIPFHKGTSREQQRGKSTPVGFLDMERFVRERPKNSSLPRAEFLNPSVPRVGVPEIGHAGESRAFPIGKDAVSNSVWIYVPKASGAEAVRDAKRLTELLNSPLYAKISRAYSNGFRLEKHEIDSFPFVPAIGKAGSIRESKNLTN